MTKLRLVLSTMTAMLVAACNVEEDVTICHFPEGAEDSELLDVAANDLEDHIMDHGDLCYSEASEMCYEPDFDAFEAGGDLCPS